MWFPSVPQRKFWDITSIRAQLLPYRSVPIHRFSNIQPSNASIFDTESVFKCLRKKDKSSLSNVSPVYADVILQLNEIEMCLLSLSYCFSPPRLPREHEAAQWQVTATLKVDC